MKRSFADILNDISVSDLARMKKKVPEWSAFEGLSFPSGLSMEQCSSSVTALYKSRLCLRIAPHPTVADLTGGLGVDSWAFSQIAGKVLYNEMNTQLFEAVKSNFGTMGISNVIFSNCEIVSGSIQAFLGNDFKPDIIYLDPARRSSTGKKVFLIEDCRPDVLTLKEELLEAAPTLLIKLSPMADITMALKRLGPEVRELHCVGADGECKELLVVLQKGWSGAARIIAGGFSFLPEEESAAAVSYCPDSKTLGAMPLLFEPSSTLLKTGAFKLLCERFPLFKLGRHTQLYAANIIIPALEGLGKWFRIEDCLPFDKRTVAELGKRLERCEVTARNLPMSSEELKRKMGTASGGSTHIFAFSADFTEEKSSRLILLTSPSNT